jgi:hypothetical protein
MKEEPLSLPQKYLKILSGLMPAGAVGAALALGAAAPGFASEPPGQPAAAPSATVADRLAAIRQAVSTVATPATEASAAQKGEVRLAWGNWWHPYGFGYGWPNWNNWHNWNNWGNWFRNW